MLPTPAASDGRHGGPRQAHTQGGPPLPAVACALLPTPDAALASGGHTHRGGARSGEPLLPGAVLALLPTPTTQPTSGNGHARNLGTQARLLPTPVASDTQPEGPADLRRNSTQLRAVERLLPTPAVNDMGAGKSVEEWDAWTAKMKTAHTNGNGHRPSLAIEAARAAFDGHQWGPYAAAIARWEQATGRTAPPATEPGAKGQPRLSAAFVEWLMGLPAGHVTAVPGVIRNAQLKALGNGVVPQQAAAATAEALTHLPPHITDALRTRRRSTP